ncbi:MAG: glycerol-3-phosphate 1-O-acyltransferase PlsY [Verrucomicrobiota bacterium]
MSIVSSLLVSLVGYFLGSISFAVLIAKSQGVDIFKQGSGNPGATNVKRTLGSRWGNMVFALDAAKGFIAAAWPLWFFQDIRLGILGLFASIIGHSFSVFLRFRGGKGVATTMGGLLAVMPTVLLIGLITWLVLFYLTKFVALASICFALSLPVSAAILYPFNDPRFVLALVLSFLIVVRHRSNIARLLQGKENSFKQ